MDYVGNIFRPPSEADSLLIQVTVGCSHNRCTFCGMYREKKFQLKKWDQVKADIDEGLALPYYRRVFLCDGDVLILATRKLVRILDYIREKGPRIERIGVYGDARGILHKSVEELKELKSAGLSIVYHGMESGSDAVLERIEKGATAADQVEAAQRLKAAGITYSAIVLLGVGGIDLSEEHAKKTALALTEADPDYVGALMLMLVPGTPLWDEWRDGNFSLPDNWGLLRELRTIAAGSRLTRCRFSANHASNVLPIKANFPEEQDKIVALIDRVLELKDESLLKPDWLRGL